MIALGILTKPMSAKDVSLKPFSNQQHSKANSNKQITRKLKPNKPLSEKDFAELRMRILNMISVWDRH